MLKFLKLHHIVLVEVAEISFEEGLNILSGETGAGKSAILESLLLTLGQRADSDLLRHGCEKGSVEAAFDIDCIPQIFPILQQAGLAHEKGEYLLIKREIHANGKNRCLINNQFVQLPLLRQIGSFLLDIVGQHSHQKLKSCDYHRNTMDQFAKLCSLCEQLRNTWETLCRAKSSLNNLQNEEATRLREIEICHMELKDIEEVALQEDEEESLFEELSRLTHAEELAEKSHDAYQALSGSSPSALQLLSPQVLRCEQLANIDPSLQEVFHSVKNVELELQEAAYTLRSYHSNLQIDPDRLAIIDERLSCINRLKKKYGSTYQEIQAYQNQLLERLNCLENADSTLEELKQSIEKLQTKCDHLCADLSKKRRKAAKKLEEQVTEQIRHLNMSNALFQVNVSKQERNAFGDDKVEYFLMPNTGEKCVSIRACASGGELSRTLLGLKTVLASSEQTSTLFFDEIDANIGGETASTVAKKLKELGKKHQILCITHLPQVAKEANHHLKIEKIEHNGRTFTQISSLSLKERKEEITRMLGGKSFVGEDSSKLAETILNSLE